MNILFVLLMVVAAPAIAENWVVMGGTPHVAMYDKDTITRQGAFSTVFIGVDSKPYGWMKFDCLQPKLLDTKVMRPPNGNKSIPHDQWTPEWESIPPDHPEYIAIQQAVCSKWWEFWKR